MVKPYATLLCPAQDVTHLFGQSIQCCIYDLPISTGKKTAYMGCGTMGSFRHPLGSWNVSREDGRGGHCVEKTKT